MHVTFCDYNQNGNVEQNYEETTVITNIGGGCFCTVGNGDKWCCKYLLNNKLNQHLIKQHNTISLV